MAGRDLKISMPSEKIKIGRSELPGSAGRGYFAKRDIAAHEELFRRKPLILVPDFDRESGICDWCYTRAVDKYRNGGESQAERKLMNCAKCSSVWYCCSVSQLSTLSLSSIDKKVELPEAGMARLSQIRVRHVHIESIQEH